MATETLPQFSLLAPRVPHCHPDRRLYAKGLCTACYRRMRFANKVERATCHPDRTHAAHGLCKNCYKARLQRTRPVATKKARNHRINLRRFFGISVADFDRMLIDQSGLCACCSKQFGSTKTTTPNVDHNHSTGKIRALVCFQCNVAIAHYERLGMLPFKYLEQYDK